MPTQFKLFIIYKFIKNKLQINQIISGAKVLPKSFGQCGNRSVSWKDFRTRLAIPPRTQIFCRNCLPESQNYSAISWQGKFFLTKKSFVTYVFVINLLKHKINLDLCLRLNVVMWDLAIRKVKFWNDPWFVRITRPFICLELIFVEPFLAYRNRRNELDFPDNETPLYSG